MLRRIWFVTLREWRYIKGDRRLMFIMLAVPLLYTSLFGTLYWRHVVKEIPTVIFDQSNTALSREVVTAFRDAEKFRVVGYAASEAEVRELLDGRRAICALVIPPDFDRRVRRGDEARILVIVNGSNMLHSNAVLTAATEITGTLSAGLSARSLEAQGFLPQAAEKTAVPLGLGLRVWYNPTFNYTNFLVPGLVATVAQQITLLYVAVAVAREKERNTLGDLKRDGVPAAAVILGKMAAYLPINLLTFTGMLIILTGLFSVPFRGSLPALLLLATVFLLCIHALGIFLSTVCRNELEATQLAMLVAVPSFLFSGYTWPLHAMPLPARAVAHLFPLTYFATDLRDIALMGVGLREVLPDLLVLGGAAAVLVPASVYWFSRSYARQEIFAGETSPS